MSHNFKRLVKIFPLHAQKCMPYIDSPFHSVHHTIKSIYSSQSFSSSIHQSSMMFPEMEKPRITEIMVRMDCNGCVQKIKKALHGITGIYDIYVDFPQQKLTIIGWADPHKIVKAIKKTRKTAIICSHTEQQSEEPPAQPKPEEEPDSDAPPEGGAPPPESSTPPTEPPQTEAPPPPESQNEPPPPPEAENPPPEAKQSNESDQDNTNHHNEPSRPKDHEEVHVIYHHPPPEYGYRYPYGHYVQPMGPIYRQMPPQQPQPPQQTQPVYVTHSYNSYKPSPYVTEYADPQSQPQYSYYSRPEPYSQVYYTGYSGSSNSRGNGNGNITSIFSEENPNACTIV